MMLPRMMSRIALLLVVIAAVLLPGVRVRAQADPHAALDRILDVYVRDGLVYYAALRTERANLDRYVGSLERAEWVAGASSADQRAKRR